MIKLLACACVIACCSYMGVSLSHEYRSRIRQIRELIEAFKILEFEITFLQNPVSYAFENVSKSCNGAVSDIFSEWGRLLRHGGHTAAQALDLSLVTSRHSLHSNEIGVLRSFAVRLGASDTSGQKESISALIGRLHVLETEAVETDRKNSKMYSGLGVLAGLLAVVILY